MASRIITPQAKATFIVISYAISFTLGIALGLVATVTIGTLTYALLLSASIVLGTQMFRGETEPVDPPRPWWKMTARPPAGFVLAALFGVQAVAIAIRAASAERYAPLSALAVMLYVVVAALYLISSIRLARRAR